MIRLTDEELKDILLSSYPEGTELCNVKLSPWDFTITQAQLNKTIKYLAEKGIWKRMLQPNGRYKEMWCIPTKDWEELKKESGL